RRPRMPSGRELLLFPRETLCVVPQLLLLREKKETSPAPIGACSEINVAEKAKDPPLQLQPALSTCGEVCCFHLANKSSMISGFALAVHSPCSHRLLEAPSGRTCLRCAFLPPP